MPDRLKQSRIDLLLCALLGLLVLLVYLPVLVSPHWGLFDDAGLILQNCRLFWSDPHHHMEWLKYIWRPGLYFWVLAIWMLSPNNPFGFYLVNYFTFAATVILTYKICVLISRSRAISFILALVWLFTPSTFEVIYTLDKQEEYLPLLFNIVLWAYLSTDRSLLKGQYSKLRLITSGTLMLLAMLAGIISKETTQLLLVSAALFAAFPLWRCWQLRAWEDVVRKDKFALWSSLIPLWYRTMWSLTFLLLMVGTYIWYKATFLFFETHSGYIVLNFRFKHIMAQLGSYLAVVPGFFALLLLCIAALLFSIQWKKGKILHGPDWQAAVVLTLSTICGCAAMLVFSSFQSPLAYIWLPLHAFILPATAYFCARAAMLGKKRFKPAPLLVLGLLLSFILWQLPEQYLKGQFQFQMDSLASDLTKAIVDEYEKQGKKPVVIALPFRNMDASEVGERIEYLTRDRLTPGYIESEKEEWRDNPISFYAYVEYSGFDPNQPPKQVGDKESLRFRSLDLHCVSMLRPDYVGLIGFSNLSGASPTTRWVKGEFGKGDWLLVPYGDIPYDKLPFRGSVVFSKEWQYHTAFIPQVKLKELFRVHRRIHSIASRGATLGWVCFRVEDSPPLSWPIYSDGWVENKTQILFAPELNHSTFKLHTMRDPADPILTHCMHCARKDNSLQLEASEQSQATTIEKKDNDTWLDIPLSCEQPILPNRKVYGLQLRSPNAMLIPPDKRRFLIHVIEASVK